MCAGFRKFRDDERGVMTFWLLVWSIVFIGFAGLAIDVSNLYRMRALLQSTADAAAHAGVIQLAQDLDAGNGTGSVATTAISFAQLNLPTADYGNVVVAADVAIGEWTPATGGIGGTFDTSSATPNAVRVVARRDTQNGNALETSLLRIIDIDSWNVAAVAIAETSQPPCLYDGIVARGYVEMNNDNTYGPDMCVHGQNGVRVGPSGNGKDNTFAAGTNVTAPSRSMILGDPASNPGLTKREGFLEPWMVDQLPTLIADLKAGDVFGSSFTVVDISEADFFALLGIGNGGGGGGGGKGKKNEPTPTPAPAGLTPNTVYNITCSGNQLVLGQNESVAIRDVALVADCRLKFSAGAELENVTLATTAIGANDEIHFAAQQNQANTGGCSTFGAVRLLTYGDIKYAAQQAVYGMQLVAGGDVSMTTQFVGSGLSIQAGGNVDMTNKNSFSTCPNGAAPELTGRYFRVAQ